MTTPAKPARPSPQGAREQVMRLLTLVPLLHARGEVRLEEAARLLGVTPQQLVKDLNVLFLVGRPGGYPDDLIEVDLDALVEPEPWDDESEPGVEDGETDGDADAPRPGTLRADGVVRVSNAEYLARPLRLTPTEATAMVVALRALRGSATEAAPKEVLDRALAKIEAALAEGSASARIDPGEEPVDPAQVELETRLEQAVREQRQVRLVYFNPTHDEETERVVDPRGLARSDGHAYLDAWCHLAEGPRLFRLDRIRSADVLDVAVSEPGATPRDLSGGVRPDDEAAVPVTLRLRPGARWMVEYYAVDDLRPGPDGTTDVDLVVADPRWLEKLWLRLAPDAEVVSPPGFTERFTAVAQAALRLYERDDVD